MRETVLGSTKTSIAGGKYTRAFLARFFGFDVEGRRSNQSVFCRFRTIIIREVLVTNTVLCRFLTFFPPAISIEVK